jgi:hypothetical protein
VLIPLFLCIGFMLAVLYIDLMFDVSALPYRRTNSPIPKEVLDPIASYYRRVVQNPYVLMFVMLVATTSIVAEIVYALVPQWVGYSSLALMGLSMVAGTLKVIPTAQRLAADNAPDDARSRMVHSMLPFHIVLLVNILLLAAIQFKGAAASL